MLCCSSSSPRLGFCFLDRVHATVSAVVQGQRVSGGFILITGQDGIRYALRPNQVAVVHDAVDIALGRRRFVTERVSVYKSTRPN